MFKLFRRKIKLHSPLESKQAISKLSENIVPQPKIFLFSQPFTIGKFYGIVTDNLFKIERCSSRGGKGGPYSGTAICGTVLPTHNGSLIEVEMHCRHSIFLIIWALWMIGIFFFGCFDQFILGGGNKNQGIKEILEWLLCMLLMLTFIVSLIRFSFYKEKRLAEHFLCATLEIPESSMNLASSLRA